MPKKGVGRNNIGLPSRGALWWVMFHRHGVFRRRQTP